MADSSMLGWEGLGLGGVGDVMWRTHVEFRCAARLRGVFTL